MRESKVFLLLIGMLIFTVSGCGKTFSKKPIKVGILHSLSGTMAISEKSVVDATLMAIDEINEKGGILGRKIKAIVVDGKSDWPTFAREAKRLITEEKVSVVFGCWTSASRKTVKPIFEEYNSLLFYPVQYEGLEYSPNIIYTGAAPNQQIIPAVKWAFDNLGKRFFLVASDYVFPRAANAIIKDQVVALRGEIVGEGYLFLGSKDVKGVIQDIIKTQPDVILNTINGDTNLIFFRELHESGVSSNKIPVLSFSIGERETSAMDLKEAVGDYACWNYFQGIDTEENRNFVGRFKKKYGQDQVISDPMEAGYLGVYLWAQAVREAGTDDVKEVRKTVVNQSFNAPEGMVFVEPENNHLWKIVRIGKIEEDGHFGIVWSSKNPIKPLPYPIYRSRSDWDKMIQGLYDGWGGQWAKPEK